MRGLNSIANVARLVVIALSISVLAFQTGASAEEGVEIGFMLKTMQEERYQADRRLFIEAAEALGATVKFVSSGNDELRQLQQLEEMLDGDVT